MSKYAGLRADIFYRILPKVCRLRPEVDIKGTQQAYLLTDGILPIIAERCVFLDEKALPENPYERLYENQAPNNIEIMLKVEKVKAYGKAQQDMVNNGWLPVKEIKKE